VASVLVVIADYQVQPGRGDEVARVLARHAAASSAEAGCLAFEVERSIEDRDHFVLHEVYVDEQAFQSHRETPHFKDNIGQIVPLLAGRTFERYERVEPSEPSDGLG
jgi:quinol monooxygenase YgiN